MGKLVCLDKINPGERARVNRICSTGSMRRRLLDMGLIGGTEVECVGKSPFGDPSAFLIRGAVVAIRSEDCADIIIERVIGRGAKWD